ncbi:MAG: tyrosine-type recombinase/integrase [Clostridia bacterium]|nr:tyrosine-type recombinase/integrase [Clostridia bacterium]
MLKAVLESAKQDRLIDFNPADDHRLVIPSKRKKVREALPMEAVQDILANLGKLETMDQRYMALAIFTSMRRGEIIRLRWGDIDLENNILHVQRNVTFPKGTNDPYIGTTKTESGVRPKSRNLHVLHKKEIVQF